MRSGRFSLDRLFPSRAVRLLAAGTKPHVLPVLVSPDEEIKRKVCNRPNVTESEKHLLLGLVQGLKNKARRSTLVKLMNVDVARFNELAKDLQESGDLIKTDRGVYKNKV